MRKYNKMYITSASFVIYRNNIVKITIEFAKILETDEQMAITLIN